MSCSRFLFRGATGLALVALLTACAGIPRTERQAAERSRFEAYAGKPIDHFTWFSRYDGWEPIAKDQLVVWTAFDTAYLITVFPPCTNLLFAQTIGLTSTSDTVYARFDSVRARGWRCMIKTIQPVDYRRMLHDLRTQHAARAHAATRAADKPPQR